MRYFENGFWESGVFFFQKNYLFLRLTNHQKNKTEEQGKELSDLEIQKTPTKYVGNKLKKYCITNRVSLRQILYYVHFLI